jgi:hypothetical protein
MSINPYEGTPYDSSWRPRGHVRPDGATVGDLMAQAHRALALRPSHLRSNFAPSRYSAAQLGGGR